MTILIRVSATWRLDWAITIMTGRAWSLEGGLPVGWKWLNRWRRWDGECERVGIIDLDACMVLLVRIF
jgi:hypothetical protein